MKAKQQKDRVIRLTSTRSGAVSYIKAVGQDGSHVFTHDRTKARALTEIKAQEVVRQMSDIARSLYTPTVEEA